MRRPQADEFTADRDNYGVKNCRLKGNIDFEKCYT